MKNAFQKPQNLESPLIELDVFPHDSHFLRKGASLSVKEFTFKELSDITYQQLHDENFLSTLSEEKFISAQSLKVIIDYTNECWQRVQEKQHVVIPDDPMGLFQLLTQKHTHILVLRANQESNEGVDEITRDELQGYVIFNTERSEYPDLKVIPEELLNQNPIRGLRAHTFGDGLRLGLPGEGLQLLMKNLFELRGKRPIITKVCTGPNGYEHRWAHFAFTKMGFEDTGHRVMHTALNNKGAEVSLEFSWLQYPPSSPLGLQRLERYERSWQAVPRARLTQFSDTSAYIAPSGLTIQFVCSGQTPDVALLAGLFPENQVVGIELDSTSKAPYQPNARTYRYTPEALQVAGPVGVIILSNVISSIVSHTDPDDTESSKPHQNPAQVFSSFLSDEINLLNEYGVLEIRDRTLSPWLTESQLKVRTDDGLADGPIQSLATDKLLEDFLHAAGEDFSHFEISSSEEKFRSFALDPTLMESFAHSRCYTNISDWPRERKNFVYFSSSELENLLNDAGLRILESTPKRSSWIEENHFKPHFQFVDNSGAPLPYPVANHFVIARKVPVGEGIKLYERSHQSVITPSFLRITRFQNRMNGAYRDIAERPDPEHNFSNKTGAALFWYWGEDHTPKIWIKSDFPRPIMTVRNGNRLDGSITHGYSNEEVAAVMDSGQTFQECLDETLLVRAGLEKSDLIRVDTPHRMLAAPGESDETLDLATVQIQPQLEPKFASNYSGFQSSGRLNGVDLFTYLRSAPVRGRCSQRILLAGYDLLLKEIIPPGTWIGQELNTPLTEHPTFPFDVKRVSGKEENALQLYRTSDSELIWQNQGEPLPENSYFGVYEGDFAEVLHGSKRQPQRSLEYLLPKTSKDNVVIMPIVKTTEGIYLILEKQGEENIDPIAERDLKLSSLIAARKYIIPPEVTLENMNNYIAHKLQEDLGLTVRQSWSQAAKYVSSSGSVPTETYSYAAEVKSFTPKEGIELVAMSVKDFLKHRHDVVHSPTLLSAYWIAHQFDCLKEK